MDGPGDKGGCARPVYRRAWGAKVLTQNVPKNKSKGLYLAGFVTTKPFIDESNLSKGICIEFLNVAGEFPVTILGYVGFRQV